MDRVHDIFFQSLHSDCKVECLPTGSGSGTYRALQKSYTSPTIHNSETANVGCLDTLFLAAQGHKVQSTASE